MKNRTSLTERQHEQSDQSYKQTTLTIGQHLQSDRQHKTSDNSNRQTTHTIIHILQTCGQH